jgi:hypothetical protein
VRGGGLLQASFVTGVLTQVFGFALFGFIVNWPIAVHIITASFLHLNIWLKFRWRHSRKVVYY